MASRASRRDTALISLRDVAARLQDLADEQAKDESEVSADEDAMEGQTDLRTDSEIAEEASTVLEDVDTAELESLREEIGNWRDNMQGTNLENTEKYSRLEECFDALDSAIISLESLGSISCKDDIDSVISDIDSAIGDAENAEFPTMFG